jgi:GrpB-like predicted nucleotidyltransferase (UPF0157 family)
MTPEPIVLADYDPRWPQFFEELKKSVASALGGLAVTIEHVGSTAVPGLVAKPIIDMDVLVRSALDVAAAIERLAALGYTHQGDLGVPGREAFIAPPGTPPHHLYVCAANAPAARRHILFRNHLRADPAEARAYAALKRSAAAAFAADRDAYTRAKTAFIEGVFRHAENRTP